MKGIILAGGAGTRLHPLTLAMSKQMIPIYDKPMIYYPLSTLLYSGINEILIISTPHDLPIFQKLLGDGSHLGCSFSYEVQHEPNGLAQAFIIGEDFIGKDEVCLILGDNIFQMKIKMLSDCNNINGGIIFGYHVQDPERYGVVEFDANNKAISIEEKPQTPKSNYAVPGLYYYDNSVIDVAKEIKPLSKMYEEIKIETIIREPEMKEIDGQLVFIDKSETNIYSPEGIIEKIILETKNLRNKLKKNSISRKIENSTGKNTNFR